jgi:fatty acid desaturase|tara:strand:- start:114 stop:1304 length:1191 start_codon:yes stop_codon:yes gene_type:complete
LPTVEPLPVDLTKAQIDEFGREIQQIYDETMATRGNRDRVYILNLIRTQRSMAFASRIVIYAGLLFLPIWPHVLASWAWALVIMAVGAIMLAASKILENMEIGHNVLHAQWDWMKDPDIQSNTWEWDSYSPSDRWMNSHNVIHHTWTNVIEKDFDLGYGLFRVTTQQKWHPAYLLQPVTFLLLMTFFSGGIGLHEKALDDIVNGRAKPSEHKALFKHIAKKFWGMLRKDYLMWPGLAALITVPVSFILPEASPLLIFGLVVASNALANLIRNVWAFIVIFCGHFPDGTYVFTANQVEGESRGQWYLRQLLGSANIEGGSLLHIMSGNLSHQIEHHLFPDLCSNRYQEVAPRVEALTARYGLPYNKASLWRQFGSTWKNNIRLAFPGGKPQPEIASV